MSSVPCTRSVGLSGIKVFSSYWHPSGAYTCPTGCQEECQDSLDFEAPEASGCFMGGAQGLGGAVKAEDVKQLGTGISQAVARKMSGEKVDCLLNWEHRCGVRAKSIRAATAEYEKDQMLSKRRSKLGNGSLDPMSGVSQ